jgi:hypothetical protein
MRPRTLVVLVVLCVGIAARVSAQTAMEKATAHASPAAAATASEEVKIAMPESPGDVVLGDPTTRQRYLESMQRYYEYRANGYAYRSRVFEWQLLSSRVIFAVVLVLVGCGIYFAWVQFRAALLAARRSVKEPAAAVVNPLATQFEVSAKGVVINSSVLGVVILGLSLAFFYLYLVYVYPIQNVF